MNESDLKRLEAFIHQHFPRISPEAVTDLLAEAIVFSADGKSSEEELVTHLQKHARQQRSRTPGNSRTDTVSAIQAKSRFEHLSTDDEVLSRLSPVSEKGYDQDAMMALEKKRALWENSLAPLEYEALRLKTQLRSEFAPRYTMLFEPAGLIMLFRRARIRMMWSGSNLG